MNSLLHLATTLVVSVGVMACGPSFFTGPGFDGDGGGGSGSGTGTGGTGGTGGADSCAGFGDDHEEPTSQAVQLINRSGAPIFVAAAECDIIPYPIVADEQGTPLRYRDASNCGYTCEQLQAGPALCPADACAAAPVLRIEPQGMVELGSWSGTRLAGTTMPTSCYADALSASDACDRRLIAEPGDYHFGIEIFHDVECTDVTCECMGTGATGYCELPGATVAGPSTAVTKQSAFPSNAAVELVVQ